MAKTKKGANNPNADGKTAAGGNNLPAKKKRHNWGEGAKEFARWEGVGGEQFGVQTRRNCSDAKTEVAKWKDDGKDQVADKETRRLVER